MLPQEWLFLLELISKLMVICRAGSYRPHSQRFIQWEPDLQETKPGFETASNNLWNVAT